LVVADPVCGESLFRFYLLQKQEYLAAARSTSDRKFFTPDTWYCNVDNQVSTYSEWVCYHPRKHHGSLAYHLEL